MNHPEGGQGNAVAAFAEDFFGYDPRRGGASRLDERAAADRLSTARSAQPGVTATAAAETSPRGGPIAREQPQPGLAGPRENAPPMGIPARRQEPEFSSVKNIQKITAVALETVAGPRAPAPAPSQRIEALRPYADAPAAG